MAIRRSFVRKGEAGFSGWGCSACEWVYPYQPRRVPDSGAVALRAFDEHRCEKHSKRKPHEDVVQAAARIVREATEK